MWLGEIFIGWFLQKVSLCIGWPNNSCKIIVHWIARWQLLFLNWGHRKNLSWNCWAEINQLPIQKSERIYCPRREQASQICAGFSLRFELENDIIDSENTSSLIPYWGCWRWNCSLVRLPKWPGSRWKKINQRFWNSQFLSYTNSIHLKRKLRTIIILIWNKIRGFCYEKIEKIPFCDFWS